MQSSLSPVSKILTLSALCFLALGNFLGILLSLLLTWPNLNTFIEPYTYGKWIPVHLNFQLYGWSSIPLIGVIYFVFLKERAWFSRFSFSPIIVWSMSLIVGAVSWLNGNISGKLFLEWQGFSAYFFLFNLVFLWIFLCFKFWSTSKIKQVDLSFLVKLILLVILGLIPFIFYKALDPHVFPPINKISSGATGSSLLLSSLVIVFIMLVFPLILQVKQKRKRAHLFPSYVLALHFFSCLFINLSDSTNNDLDQFLGLGSIVIWLPILLRYYSSYKFTHSSILWLFSALIWGAILIVSAVYMFLPKSLIIAKFSSILVAHVHLAMAGLVTSLCIIILCAIPFNKGIGDILGEKLSFYAFQAGLLFYLLSLLGLGALEYTSSGVLYSYPGSIVSVYLIPLLMLRLLSGMLLLLASLRWLRKVYDLESVHFT